MIRMRVPIMCRIACSAGAAFRIGWEEAAVVLKVDDDAPTGGDGHSWQPR